MPGKENMGKVILIGDSLKHRLTEALYALNRSRDAWLDYYEESNPILDSARDIVWERLCELDPNLRD